MEEVREEMEEEAKKWFKFRGPGCFFVFLYTMRRHSKKENTTQKKAVTMCSVLGVINISENINIYGEGFCPHVKYYITSHICTWGNWFYVCVLHV